MKLNNIWGYGQLFGFSGLEGENNYYNDFIGTLTRRKVEIRFEFRKWMSIYFPFDDISFKAIMSDFIEDGNKEFFITFKDNDTLVGYSKVKPEVFSEGKLFKSIINNIEIYKSFNNCFGIKTEIIDGKFYFVIYHSNSIKNVKKFDYSINIKELEEIKEKRYEYYSKMPLCKDKRYEELYYKALSVNKVNVYSPIGKIKRIWTTPDRVPHRNMWLWDSVLHALSFLTYNEEFAKEAISAVLDFQRKDGFIPHMITPNKISNITQPQVLSWGVWEVYKKTKDIKFLKDNVDKLDRYLKWDINNRDKNKNGLLEWHTNPLNKNCKCDESGLDNSPRFDFDINMDAIDFTAFSARDAKYLSYIYNELGNKDKTNEWESYFNTTKDKINNLMWDEETSAYYDRLFDGSLTKVLTPASYLPMFSEVSTKEQASKMVESLVKKELLWTEFPVSTISRSDYRYSTDMWRGGTWINLNYFIIKGLLNYGYNDLANELKEKTLSEVYKWYKETGVIYEFYDSNGKVAPIHCLRKGKQKDIPDYRDHMHSISDFNWSSCFILLFIQDEFY